MRVDRRVLIDKRYRRRLPVQGNQHSPIHDARRKGEETGHTEIGRVDIVPCTCCAFLRGRTVGRTKSRRQGKGDQPCPRAKFDDPCSGLGGAQAVEVACDQRVGGGGGVDEVGVEPCGECEARVPDFLRDVGVSEWKVKGKRERGGTLSRSKLVCSTIRSTLGATGGSIPSRTCGIRHSRKTLVCFPVPLPDF